MPSNPALSRLRAVVSEAEDGFIVSACVVTAGDPPAFVGEETVPTLAAAQIFIARLATEVGCPSDTVEIIFNLEDGSPDRSHAH